MENMRIVPSENAVVFVLLVLDDNTSKKRVSLNKNASVCYMLLFTFTKEYFFIKIILF